MPLTKTILLRTKQILLLIRITLQITSKKIADNKTAITKNTDNIATNRQNIADNKAAITKNTSDIATNKNNIATNKD